MYTLETDSRQFYNYECCADFFREFTFAEVVPKVRIAAVWGKTSRKSFREVTIVSSLASCDLSHYMYPEKKSGPLPASSHVRQPAHTARTVVHEHRLPRTSQSTSKTGSLVNTRRRTTVESTEAQNGSWNMARTRGVGLV